MVEHLMRLLSERSGFETYLRRIVSLSKTLYSPKVLVIPKKLLFNSDMTEKKMLTGTLSLNTNQQKRRIHSNMIFFEVLLLFLPMCSA